MKFYIKFEPLGGKWYYMIYKKGIFKDTFFERWNTPKNAILRLSELN